MDFFWKPEMRLLPGRQLLNSLSANSTAQCFVSYPQVLDLAGLMAMARLLLR